MIWIKYYQNNIYYQCHQIIYEQKKKWEITSYFLKQLAILFFLRQRDRGHPICLKNLRWTIQPLCNFHQNTLLKIIDDGNWSIRVVWACSKYSAALWRYREARKLVGKIRTKVRNKIQTELEDLEIQTKCKLSSPKIILVWQRKF